MDTTDAICPPVLKELVGIITRTSSSIGSKKLAAEVVKEDKNEKLLAKSRNKTSKMVKGRD